MYEDIILNIYDNSKENTIYYHKGIYGYIEKGISFVTLDEELIKYKPVENISINVTPVEDENLIKEINYQIRSGIRNLCDNEKEIYNYFASRRMEHYRNLREGLTQPIYLQNGEEYYSINSKDISLEDLAEIKKYISELYKVVPDKKKNENGKKLRKRKNNKGNRNKN